jgi:hypothetical protein
MQIVHRVHKKATVAEGGLAIGCFGARTIHKNWEIGKVLTQEVAYTEKERRTMMLATPRN